MVDFPVLRELEPKIRRFFPRGRLLLEPWDERCSNCGHGHFCHTLFIEWNGTAEEGIALLNDLDDAGISAGGVLIHMMFAEREVVEE